jgi:hypothetical protein
MSKGPGRIERAIKELFSSNPDLAFGVIDLVEHCFPGAAPEKKHSVSVIRAGHKVADADPDWTVWRGEGQGAALVFVNQASLQSHCLGFLIADNFFRYRSPKRALRCYWGADAHRAGHRMMEASSHLMADRASLLAELAPGGRHGPGGRHDLFAARKKFVDLHIAERDGDPRAGEMRAEMEAGRAAVTAAFRAAFGKGQP